MDSSSPIPRFLEDATKRMSELQIKVRECEEIISRASQAKADLEDELNRVEDFIIALREEGDKTTNKQTLNDIIIDLFRSAENDLSPYDISSIVQRDRRHVERTVKELLNRGVIVKTKEEKVMGRYTRKYYAIAPTTNH